MDEVTERDFNFARGLRSIGSLSEAVDILKKIINSCSFWIDPYRELSSILWELGRFDEAIIAIETTIKLDPNHSADYLLLGHIMRETDKLPLAITAYNKAIAISPNSAELHHSLALAFKENNCFKEAFQHYEKALSLAPNEPEIHNNRSILSLLIGDFKAGFEEYEWRKHKRERYGNRSFKQPLWRGESLIGKTLLVHHEQGMGDAIQFSRYLKVLQGQGGRILYDAHEPMRRLLSSMGDITFANASDPYVNFDYHCPLLSLPRALGTTLQTIPNSIPYIRSEPDIREKWTKRIGDRGFKIGVAWQGSGGRYAFNRLFPVSLLQPLTKFKNVRLIGLHKMALNEPWKLPDGLNIEPLGFDFDASHDAFVDSAAVIDCCDLVISCDTAIAHLAGAMGVPTWVMLRNVPHWVWMMERNDSPWYPNTRLFRQFRPGDWESAFNLLYVEIEKLLNSNI